MNKIVFGQYYNVDSWIHRLDPRTKLIVLFAMMIGIFLIKNVYVLLGCILFIFIIVLSSRIPIKKFLNSFKMIAMLLVFSMFFQVAFNNQGNIVTIGNITLDQQFDFTILSLILIIAILFLYFFSGRYIKKYRVISFIICLILIFYIQTIIHITPSIAKYNIALHEEAVISSARILLRMMNLLSLSALLTLTTKPTDLNNGIEGLFAPFKFMRKSISIMATMISIALRSIPTLLLESQKILKAQASRGVDFNEGKLKNKIVQIISLLVPMFVIAYNRSMELAFAMEARGYIPGAPRTTIHILKYRWVDYVSYIFVLTFIGAIITAKIMWGI